MFTYCKKVIAICLVVFVGVVILAAGRSQDKRAAQDNRVSITGSGNVIARELALTDFDRLEAGLFFDLLIRQGETHQVLIFSDDNFIDFIRVERTGTTLAFGLKPGYAYDFRGVTMRAEVTMPVLAGLQLDSSSHVKLDGFTNQGPFDAELVGSSFLNGRLDGDGVDLKVYGSAVAALAGSAKRLGVNACGSGQVDLSDFQAQRMTLEASCASTVKVSDDSIVASHISQNARLVRANQ